MRKKLGEILIASGAVSQGDLDLALSDQTAGEPARLGDLLVALGRITPLQLARALSQQHAIPFIQLPQVPPDVLLSVPVEFQQQHRVVPFRVTPDSISLAMADPSNADAVESLRKLLNKKITRYVAAGDEIDAVHAELANDGVSLPMVAPSVAPLVKTRPTPAPSEAELFGSLSLDEQGPGLGDELFSGLDLPPSVADVPPPPKVAPLKDSKASRRKDDEDEPEFFEASPVAAPKPAAKSPTPATKSPKPSETPTALEDIPLDDLDGGAVSFTEETETIDVATSGLFGTTGEALVPVDEEVSISEEPPPPEPSGSFDVSFSETSGDFPSSSPSSAAVDDFFSAGRPVASSTPPPVPSPFTTEEEEAVSFEEVSEPDDDEPETSISFDEPEDTDDLFSEVAAAAAALPEPAPPSSDVDPLPSESAPSVPLSTTPSWLTSPSSTQRAPSPLPTRPVSPVPAPAPVGAWTGQLDELPPSKLSTGAVKALVLKGLLTEAEILEALGKKA